MPRTRDDITARVLAFVASYAGQHGYSPTLREIATALDLSSTSVAAWHLDKLERQRRITRTPGLSRTIRLVEIAPAGGRQEGSRT